MAAPKITAPKGTRDLFDEEVVRFTELETIARRVFDQFQFSEVRTPIFESVDLFSRTLGATSDVVEKEMFAFEDRGGRHFSLRPEGTAGVVRFFLENKLFVKGGTHRLFYIGPMFRAERPQAGRYRQFWQIGSEYFGDPDPTADADTVLLACKIFRDFGLTDFTVQINSLGDDASRAAYQKALLSYLETKKDQLTEESQQRMTKNPLRVLDSKKDGPKLGDAPSIKDYWTDASRAQYELFASLLEKGGIPVQENTRLVRGLDYYTGPVFEIVSPHLGAQNALAAGGRYDGLVAQLGGPSVPGTGFSLGMDRVVSVPRKKDPKADSSRKVAVVAPLDGKALIQGFLLANALREKGVLVPPVVAKKKLKNILSSAVEIGANWAILIGEDELAKNQATVKNLANREQSQVEFGKVSEFLLS